MKTKTNHLAGAVLSLIVASGLTQSAVNLNSRLRSHLLLRLLQVLAMGWFAASAPAQDIFDAFNYGPGLNLIGQSPVAPLTWVGAGTAGPQQARIQAGALQWPGLSNSAPNRILIRAGNGPSSVFVFGTSDTMDAYPPITFGTVYFSFVLRVTDLTGFNTGNYFAGFTPNQATSATPPANVFTRVLLRPSGAGYNIGLVKSSPVVANFTWDTTVFATGDTVLLVGAYEFSGENADISYLWINPDPTTFCSTTPPAATLVNSAGPDATFLASVAYMQRPLPDQPSAMLTDELRVALFWDGVVRPGWDYPDAPGAYHTLFGDNAARHTVVPGVFMGNNIDVECDGQPTVLADGDDTNKLDDGDGVGGTAGPWVTGGTKNITITVSVNGKIDAYFDWNKNNSFDPGEKVFASVDVFAAAPNTLTVTVPPGAATGFTYARFRFSTVGGLGAVGPAPDGEVEDYRIQVQAPPPPPPDLALDVSAVPQPVIDGSNLTYSITVSNKGAGVASSVVVSHGYINITHPIGLSVTASTSQGSCSNSASGVVCHLGTLQPGATATISVVGIPDFDQLATLYNIPEMQEVIDVTNTVTVASAETDAMPADNSAAVVVAIVPLRDFGDAPVPTYPTLLPTAARHRLGALRFGTLIDAEPNGQPVDLDDTTGVNDEFVDGFNLPAGGFYVGGWTTINIQVSGAAGGYIDLWIDFDGVPGWGAADHVLAAAWHPGGGAVMPLAVLIPPGTTPGLAWARARLHKNPAGLPTGYGGSGEVVDFQANVLPAAVDLVAVANPAEIVLTEGDLLTQTITVSNQGPSTATEVTLRVHFPSGATLESFQLSQGAGQMEGTNLVCSLGTLAPNANALVTFTAGTSNLFEGHGEEFIDFRFDVFGSVAAIELNPDDNIQHDVVRVFASRDFSDAPYSDTYHTREIHDGARHRIGGPFFGNSPAGHTHRDADPDGMPSPNADGDNSSDGNDDERGVRLLDLLYLGATSVRIEINAPLGGRVDGFIDWNRNHSWDDPGDQIFVSLLVPAGVSVHTISVPPGALPGDTYARFRISENGGLSDHGYVNNGEVEDYKFTITLPAMVRFGLEHTTLGAATITANANGLLISNLGSSGQDGVRINLSRSQGWRASVTREPALAAGFTTVYSINIVGVTGGMSNQPLATMRLERQGSNLLFSADFSPTGATQYTAAFYDSNGNQVNNTRPFQNLEVIPLYPDCPDGYIPDCEWVCFFDSATGAMHLGFLLCRGCLKFPDDTTFPGEGPLLCILTPVAPARSVQNISAIEIRGGSTAPSISNSILLTSEATQHLAHWQRAVGGAFVGTTDTNALELRVSNLGSSGEDGFEVLAGGSGSWYNDEFYTRRIAQTWRDGEMPWLTSSNSYVKWTVTGRITGSAVSYSKLEDLLAFKQEQGTGLAADFTSLGATQAVVEVFNGPTFVGSVTLPAGDLGTISTGSVRRVTAQIIDGGPVWGLTLNEGIWLDNFRPRDGSPVLRGNRLRVIPLNPTATVDGLRSLITLGANVESFALSGFNSTEPQRPRLRTPRFLPDWRVSLPLSTEPDVAYHIETGSSVNGPWTSIGQVMGTDGLNEAEFEDTTLRISNRVRLFRVRIH